MWSYVLCEATCNVKLLCYVKLCVMWSHVLCEAMCYVKPRAMWSCVLCEATCYVKLCVIWSSVLCEAACYVKLRVMWSCVLCEATCYVKLRVMWSREFNVCADIAAETGICVDDVRNALKSLDVVTSPLTWYRLSDFSQISAALRGCQTIDEVGQLLWVWFGCRRKSADFFVCNFGRHQLASRIHNSRMQTKSADFWTTDDRFLLADFIGRQNQPTLSIVWHRL